MENKKIKTAYTILYFGFIALPVIAGADKFFDLLTEWTKYLAPMFPHIFSISPESFMHIVGVIEIAAGILVAWKPRVFAFVVAAWLAGIIVNLLILGSYFDIALRDLGLCLTAIALGLIARSRPGDNPSFTLLG